MTIKATSIENAVEQIMEDYKNNEACIGELLADTKIEGLTVEEIVTVYARLYVAVEGDKVIRINIDEKTVTDLSK